MVIIGGACEGLIEWANCVELHKFHMTTKDGLGLLQCLGVGRVQSHPHVPKVT